LHALSSSCTRFRFAALLFCAGAVLPFISGCHRSPSADVVARFFVVSAISAPTSGTMQGFAVLGIDMDDEGWDAVKPFVSDVGINYRIVVGNDSTADKFGGIEALPTTFLIDRDGKIADVHVGLTSKGDFENAIEQLLQTPAHGGGIMEGRLFPVGASGRMPVPAELVGAR